MNYQTIIDKYYPVGTRLRDIYLCHCRSVAAMALEINRRCQLGLDENRVEAAAMLHDIGIYATNAPGIECHGKDPYICHGILGRDLLLAEGVEQEVAETAARHTGSGLTAEEIRESGLPLPAEDLRPQTLLQRLICYADKFYSKSGNMKRKPLEKIRAGMANFGEASLARFDDLHREFSSPQMCAW